MIFDDFKSILHFLFGIFTSFVSHLNIFVAIVLVAIFLAYEYVESNSLGELLCDCFEFVLGLAAGSIILRLRIPNLSITH
jgi:hypothetical protein